MSNKQRQTKSQRGEVLLYRVKYLDGEAAIPIVDCEMANRLSGGTALRPVKDQDGREFYLVRDLRAVYARLHVAFRHLAAHYAVILQVPPNEALTPGEIGATQDDVEKLMSAGCDRVFAISPPTDMPSVLEEPDSERSDAVFRVKPGGVLDLDANDLL